MAQLIRMTSDRGKLLVAVRTPGDTLEAAGAVSDKVLDAVEGSLDAVFQTARIVAESFTRTVAGLQFKTAELEFGLSFSGKGTVYLVEASAAATIKVKFTS